MVNFSGIAIDSEAVVGWLTHEIRLREICQQVLNERIIASATQARNIDVTESEIQAEADRLRRERHLEHAEATLVWLADELMTVEDWEAGIYNRLLAQKLSERLFSDDIEHFFIQHRLDFERISLYKISVPYQQLAQELFYQIEESEISFYEAAHLYDIDEKRRFQCGYEGQVYRWSLPPETAAIVFGARLGNVLGPIKVEANYELLMAEGFTAAELTPQTRQEILDQMFQDWLARELNYMVHNHS